ncbi:hypothetical protein IMZ31_21400 (plasmid) [Pontibacillus sp. ALD_SL1]|uniref:hypothetical protein n=1 Tax=Pontibacillus sp. ALD_SL1 TaxID=2777185 RepID=UPI001A96517D|nr:hypothetical protein [Pontibacillus sp. ALD_SL1]QST02015.1 hypothetical protein IMZ31_21400 [Pontibacillus sp. ALD_SL1]
MNEWKNHVVLGHQYLELYLFMDYGINLIEKWCKGKDSAGIQKDMDEFLFFFQDEKEKTRSLAQRWDFDKKDMDELDETLDAMQRVVYQYWAYVDEEQFTKNKEKAAILLRETITICERTIRNYYQMHFKVMDS